MCNLGDTIERRGIVLGRALGKALGRAEGKLETTLMYYRKGRITAEEAASDLNMPLSEFLEKVKEYNQQPQT